MNARHSLYETITNDMLAELKRGVAPWVRPWKRRGSSVPLLPYNALTRKRYHGVNVLILWHAALAKGYRHPGWIGYHQALGLGGHVKKDEKSTVIVYGDTFVPEEERGKPEEEQKRVPFLKNGSCSMSSRRRTCPSASPGCRNPHPSLKPSTTWRNSSGGSGRRCSWRRPGGVLAELRPHHPARAGEVRERRPLLRDEPPRARPLDGTQKPPRPRPRGPVRDEAYAGEELIAELTAAYLCALLAIPGKLRHAEYLGHWIALLSHDARAIFTAASRATDAARYLERGGLTEETGDERAADVTTPVR